MCEVFTIDGKPAQDTEQAEPHRSCWAKIREWTQTPASKGLVICVAGAMALALGLGWQQGPRGPWI